MAVEELQNKAAEMAKKVLTVGVGALFLTEESLRGLVSDFKLPKELLTVVLDSAQKMKGEFIQSLSSDLMKHLMSRVDVAKLAEDLLQKHEVQVQLTLNFKPKTTSASDSISTEPLRGSSETQSRPMDSQS